MKTIRRFLLLVLPAPILAACQTAGESPGASGNGAAIALLQTVNDRAQTCWVKSKDKDFRAYRVIPELDTRVGKPRILIVSAKAAQGLPQLVIEAEGTPARLSSYGPLVSEAIGDRIHGDVRRWAKVDTACTA